MNTKRKPLSERFWAKVQKTDGCWLWTGSTRSGYGQIAGHDWRKTPLQAHHVSWELANGPIADGSWVLHRCDTPACVRPDHLFLGTHSDNVADMHAKGRASKIRARGERNSKAKLSELQVRELRDAYAIGEPRKAIAAEFGISERAVWLIGTGRSWKHIG